MPARRRRAASGQVQPAKVEDRQIPHRLGRAQVAPGMARDQHGRQPRILGTVSRWPISGGAGGQWAELKAHPDIQLLRTSCLAKKQEAHQSVRVNI
ncbi:hypothetical protein [Paracoccus mutanolyticus]|uniref:hypothetical protein n=1 Tax=Paracoccus mutanolyticus TaxID=1499308 RepID=UPI0011AE6C24|nr:hypothetical protein [Paracoccus mutanolyticus]